MILGHLNISVHVYRRRQRIMRYRRNGSNVRRVRRREHFIHLLLLMHRISVAICQNVTCSPLVSRVCLMWHAPETPTRPFSPTPQYSPPPPSPNLRVVDNHMNLIGRLILETYTHARVCLMPLLSCCRCIVCACMRTIQPVSPSIHSSQLFNTLCSYLFTPHVWPFKCLQF
jgi:hypothetical protein